MKEVKFRPLRRVKKTGKVVVASYMAWRKLFVLDIESFCLTTTDEHSIMPDDEFVYNHKGKQLFFYEYNPHNVPIFRANGSGNYDYENAEFTYSEIYKTFSKYGIYINDHMKTTYKMKGTDCEGVPCFHHFTADYVADHYSSTMFDFTPLTVGMVKQWYGWMLWQLQNSKLA